ncbi:aspartate/glutamate racemase family protein [Marinomonas pollencensis]|uniref:Aspartate racemase n=1 Tax=Marinomonas pollencensis TaxID=491954 RepID=A0A3E0DW23_9GAMM|nr:aspartate/glutamate racemase family protein [Marinomonas pollencensis]REG85859.1 aspartate racemase [Marinomonas pollencensis]
MKTIGIIGGMSWESTASYYSALNQGVAQSLGSWHSAKVIINSVDFKDIKEQQQEGKWEEMAETLSQAAISLEKAGADFFLIATNTMHKIAHRVADSVNIPLLHIVDSTGSALVAAGVTKVGLLATRFTMEEDFYTGYLEEKFAIQSLVPNESDRQLVHEVIYNELCLGRIQPGSRQAYLRIIDDLVDKGAQAIILGCTEIALLVKPEDTSVSLYDTTALHCDAALKLALEAPK